MELRPLVHVGDMAASLAFYEKLGAEIVHGGRDSDWVLIQLGTVQIGLLARAPDPTRGETPVELHFGASVPLEQWEQRLHRAGVPVDEVAADQDLGEQLCVRTPDGTLIKISQREP
ncbi:VOC family protein [Actinoplanes sp. NPDC026619]|uniref:VOC family protein n=1 Tax=Actinoplanes sp. NPDC026619 TaxID=3155798 RepID=UPI0033D770FC